MSISTLSQFFYGHSITSENNLLDFDEGSGELTATLKIGSYTLTEFKNELKRALDAVGALTYSVTVDRATRKITVSAGSNFDLLTQTGTHVGTSPWELIGFSVASDHTGASTYEGESETGSVYATQFVPQSYVDPEHLQKAVDSTIHESASGDVQVFLFGVTKFIEMNLKFITNQNVTDSVIRNNASGVEDAQLFLQFATKKNRMEFMPDEDDPGAFYSVILESTEEDSKGVGYRLKELYGQGLPNFFETGRLKFRVLE